MNQPHTDTLILLRGLGRDTRHWQEFMTTLQAEWPGMLVIGIDLPGNGVWNTLSSPLSCKEYVVFLRQQLVSMGIRGPVHVVAMSFGAMVAYDWLCRHPRQLRSVTLINTSMRPFCPFWSRLRIQAWPAFIGGLLRKPEDREPLVLKLTTQKHQQDQSLLIHWQALARELPVSTRNLIRQIFAASRFRARPCPRPERLLLVAGEGDRLVSVACSQSAAKALGGHLALHPEAGHDLPLDAPIWLRQQIAEHVKLNP